jgi:hypothetical protein
MAKAKNKDSLKINERKWGKPLMDAGWTAMPNTIIEAQATLKLDPLDMNILLHLAFRWWEAENKPHPAKSSMAKAMRKHPITIQRRIRALEQRGLIQREYRKAADGGNLPNKYDFTGLIKKATPLAKDTIEVREQKKRERAARDRRGGRAALVPVPPPPPPKAE